MLVEHTFVTTSSADEALGAAARFLAERGFTSVEDNAFAVGSVAVGAAPHSMPGNAVPLAAVVPVAPIAAVPVTAAPPPPLPSMAAPPALPALPAVPSAARPAWNSLHLKRPAGKFGPGMTMVTLPQTLRLDFDRHRLTLAISGEHDARVARQGLFGSGGLSANERARQVNLMFVMARSLEALLANRVPADQAAAEWKQTETQMIASADQLARRGRRNFAIAMGLVVAVGAGVILAVMNAT